MNTAAAGLTADMVEEYLRGRRVDEDSIGSVRALLTECDAARFSAGSYETEQGTEMVARAGDVLRSLEKRYLR
jgi:hypothetical protein